MHKKNSFRGFAFLLASAAIAALFFTASLSARADTTPTLALSATGDGDSVTLNVTGDPNESVVFYYLKSGASGNQLTPLGATNASGTYSTTISSSVYGIVTGTPVHVTINGLNGPASASVLWPAVSSTGSGTSTLSLSQTGVVLSVGQSSTVTASNLGSGALYVSNNSNPSIANVNISGSQITVTGNIHGSTVVTLCVVGGTATCPSIYVTVQNAGAQMLAFSQNAVSIAQGQNVPITISGGNGMYLVSNNSNPTLAQTSISGATITLSTSATSGSSSITVCSTDLASCGVITVTAGAASSSALTFSQTNPTVAVSQSTSISIYGTSGSTFYVASNSNPNVVQANVSASTLTLYGITNGTSTLSVCSSTASCGTLTVTVNYIASGGSITLSQTSLTLLTGQSLSIGVSGGTAPYSVINGAPNIAVGTMSGNTLTVTGVASGGTTLTACSAGGGCTALIVTVNASGTGSSALTLSQNSLSLAAGQTLSVSLYGIGGYYIASPANQNIASGSINGSALSVNAYGAGTTSITVCQTGGQCATLSITVGTASGGTAVAGCTGTIQFSPITGQACPIVSGTQTPGVSLAVMHESVAYGNLATFTLVPNGITNPIYSVSDSFAGSSVKISNITAAGYFSWYPTVADVGTHTITVTAADSLGHQSSTSVSIAITGSSVSPAKHLFLVPLSVGASGEEVIALQTRLTAEGVYSGPLNGNYGPLTEAAVKKYQTVHGLAALGNVGPGTRAMLNK